MKETEGIIIESGDGKLIFEFPAAIVSFLQGADEETRKRFVEGIRSSLRATLMALTGSIRISGPVGTMFVCNLLKKFMGPFEQASLSCAAEMDEVALRPKSDNDDGGGNLPPVLKKFLGGLDTSGI